MISNAVVGIIDYNSGNVRSVINAVESIGSQTRLVAYPDQLEDCSHLILPGVGAFGFCADQLRASEMLPTIEKLVLRNGKPLLGICVGMQLMADFSEEQGEHKGLSWVGGSVTKLEKCGESKIRVPHVGWNDVVFKESFGLFEAADVVGFYFDHSFAYNNPALGKELAICRHGREFSAIIKKDNIVAVQFHPEKSQTAGMRLLKSFLTL
jgi:imidazole glycerol-phosphate synthase subunit HisH